MVGGLYRQARHQQRVGLKRYEAQGPAQDRSLLALAADRPPRYHLVFGFRHLAFDVDRKTAMPSPTTLCLFDVHGLEGLSEVCREFEVRLTAHGGLVRRLASGLVANPESRSPALALFDLVPAASDIDLIHSGADAVTAQIYNSIHRHVPNAECFRWQLDSVASRAPSNKLFD